MKDVKEIRYQGKVHELQKEQSQGQPRVSSAEAHGSSTPMKYL